MRLVIIFVEQPRFDVNSKSNKMADGKFEIAEGIEVMHQGGCHCGLIRFEVKAPAFLQCIDCK